MSEKEIKAYLSRIGRKGGKKGGKVKSEAKTIAARKNILKRWANHKKKGQNEN